MPYARHRRRSFRGLELARPGKPLQSLGNGHVKSSSFIELFAEFQEVRLNSGRHNICTEACLWCGLGDPVLKGSFLVMVVHCLHATLIPCDVGSYDFQSDTDSTTRSVHTWRPQFLVNFQECTVHLTPSDTTFLA